MRLLWILGGASVGLAACAAVDTVDSRVRAHTVEVSGGQVELRVSEMLPQDGQRRFLINARDAAPLDMMEPAELSLRRHAAVEAEIGQLCPAGGEVDGHTEAMTEGLTWIRCHRS